MSDYRPTPEEMRQEIKRIQEEAERVARAWERRDREREAERMRKPKPKKPTWPKGEQPPKRGLLARLANMLFR